MRNGDPTQLKDLSSEEQKDEALREWVPDSTVGTIKEIMGALKKTNSDPMIMEHLIGHAQAALELTGDPMLVELIFERLRKETGLKSEKSKSLLENRPKPKNPKKRPVKYTMTPEQMNEAIDKLTDESNVPEDLLAPRYRRLPRHLHPDFDQRSHRTHDPGNRHHGFPDPVGRNPDRGRPQGGDRFVLRHPEDRVA